MLTLRPPPLAPARAGKLLQFDDKVSPALLPWWGWMIAAVVLWLLVVLFTDEDRHVFVRIVLIVGAVLSAMIGIVRFVKWVWAG